MLLGNKYILWN